jgi:hypothetical protein
LLTCPPECPIGVRLSRPRTEHGSRQRLANGASSLRFNLADGRKIVNTNRTLILRLFCLILLIACAGATFAQDANVVAQRRAESASARPPAGCECSPGHWWDANRKSCVTGVCNVPKMPDGDKGGSYFAWNGTLFVDTACVLRCLNLNLNTATGQPGWLLVSGPGSGYPITPVVVPLYPGWSPIAGASWISADANSGSQRGAGNYVYEYTFCLSAGAKGANLTLNFLADNGATVYLNNQQIFATSGNRNFIAPPRTVTYANSAGWIIPGMNKVRIDVANESSVTGLAATLNVRADCGECIRN